VTATARRGFVAILVALLLAACGRKGDLEPPPEDEEEAP
jgi:predicted small lipoprotein YifL